MNERNSQITCQAAVLLILFVCSIPLKAAPITFGFEGEFFNPGNETEFSSNFTPGDPVVGSFTFESTTPDSNSAADTGFYENSILGANLVIGEFSFDFDPLGYNFINVTRKYFEETETFYSLYQVGFDLRPALGVTDLSFVLNYEQLLRPTNFPNPLVLDDSLSSNPPDATSIDPSSFSHLRVTTTEFYNIKAFSGPEQIPPQLTRVPEPSSLVLISVGLLASIGLKSRRKKGRTS